jgi:hypothetical protein
MQQKILKSLINFDQSDGQGLESRERERERERERVHETGTWRKGKRKSSRRKG